MIIKEYRDLKLPSYSLLSKLSQHPKLAKAMLDGVQIKSKFMDLGSLIDMLLTAPDEVKDNYYMVEGNLPTNSYMELVTEFIRLREMYLQEVGDENPFFESDVLILQARENVQFQSGWKVDTVIKNFHENCDHYLSEYQEAGNKTIITQGEFANARRMADSVLGNDFTKKYFTPQEGIEIHYQYPIICHLGEHEVKTLLDILYINHNTKEVEIIDIKTFSETLSFTKSYLKYRYYIQGTLYSRALIEWVKKNYLSTYKIKPFKFLAIDTSGFESPMLHEMTSIDMKAATTGGLIGSYTVKGYIKLLEEYKWHMENNKWEYPKEVYDTGIKLITI